MARPQKAGLEYYPKDTGSFGDRKIRRLLNAFGCKGYVIYEYLLCVIYQDKGYYVEYDCELAFDVADYLGNGITEALVKEVVNGCVTIGLFEKGLFDLSSILTSSGIQKRYLKAKRGATIEDQLLVITVETRVITAKTPVIAAESTQSKVKKSKVNNDELIHDRLMIELKIEDCKVDPENINYIIIKFSITLYEKLKINYPLNRDIDNYTVAEFVPPVRELLEKKKYTPDQVSSVLAWAYEHKFWKSQIMHPKSIAANFEKMKEQCYG